MKIFIIHDGSGNIKGSFIPPGSVKNFGIRQSSGLHTHVMEVDDLEENERNLYLFDLHHNHVINMISEKPAVIRKKPRS